MPNSWMLYFTEHLKNRVSLEIERDAGEYPPSVRWLTEVRRAMGQRNTPSYALP